MAHTLGMRGPKYVSWSAAHRTFGQRELRSLWLCFLATDHCAIKAVGSIFSKEAKMTKSGDLRPRGTEYHLTLGLHLIFKLPLESIKSLPVRTSTLKVHNFMKLSWITLKLSNHKVQVHKKNVGESEDD